MSPLLRTVQYLLHLVQSEEGPMATRGWPEGWTCHGIGNSM